MKRIVLLVGLTAGLCGAPAFALDLDPNARAKAIAAASAIQPAPVSRPPLPDLASGGGIDSDGRDFSGACNATKSDVCYDYKGGRIIYRPTRNWMPEFSGLTPEHISVRRDRVIFQYSFK